MNTTLNTKRAMITITIIMTLVTDMIMVIDTVMVTTMDQTQNTITMGLDIITMDPDMIISNGGTIWGTTRGIVGMVIMGRIITCIMDMITIANMNMTTIINIIIIMGMTIITGISNDYARKWNLKKNSHENIFVYNVHVVALWSSKDSTWDFQAKLSISRNLPVMFPSNMKLVRVVHNNCKTIAFMFNGGSCSSVFFDLLLISVS